MVQPCSNRFNQSAVPACLEEVPPTKFTLLHDFSIFLLHTDLSIVCFLSPFRRVRNWHDEFPSRYELMEGGDLFNQIHKSQARQSRKGVVICSISWNVQLYNSPFVPSFLMSPLAKFRFSLCPLWIRSSQFGDWQFLMNFRETVIPFMWYPNWQAFPWRDRICVAYDAACGLSHLHHQTPKATEERHHETRILFQDVQVFHRDIKSPNILQTTLVYDVANRKVASFSAFQPPESHKAMTQVLHCSRRISVGDCIWSPG